MALPRGFALEIVEFIPNMSLTLAKANVVNPLQIKSLVIKRPEPSIAILKNLEHLEIGHPNDSGNTPINIAFLQGMQLRSLAIHGYRPTNLEALRGMPLEVLTLVNFMGTTF